MSQSSAGERTASRAKCPCLKPQTSLSMAVSHWKQDPIHLYLCFFTYKMDNNCTCHVDVVGLPGATMYRALQGATGTWCMLSPWCIPHLWRTEHSPGHKSFEDGGVGSSILLPPLPSQTKSLFYFPSILHDCLHIPVTRNWPAMVDTGKA